MYPKRWHCATCILYTSTVYEQGCGLITAKYTQHQGINIIIHVPGTTRYNESCRNRLTTMISGSIIQIELDLELLPPIFAQRQRWPLDCNNYDIGIIVTIWKSYRITYICNPCLGLEFISNTKYSTSQNKLWVLV